MKALMVEAVTIHTRDFNAFVWEQGEESAQRAEEGMIEMMGSEGCWAQIPRIFGASCICFHETLRLPNCW